MPEQLPRFTVSMIAEPSILAPMYDGEIDVFAEDENDAIAQARMKVRRVHGDRPFRIRSVTRSES